MSKILMVPVRLDALHLEADQMGIEAKADFTRLPFFDGFMDHNFSNANISEEIVSKTFENENLMLRAGIHLHWTVPDALTHGFQNSEGSKFPGVPNRWLVSRSIDSKKVKQWVVESNYLHPEGRGYGHVNIPFQIDPDAGKYRPYRHLGRCMTLEDWLVSREDARFEEYLPKLTVVGYGEPTFAAFYPNCYSVFGFHDPEYAGRSRPNGLSYDLIGWYDEEPGMDTMGNSFVGEDVLRTFRREFMGANDGEIPRYSDFKLGFKWSVDEIEKLGKEEKVEKIKNWVIPQTMVCYSRITFSAEDNSTRVNDVKISVANTSFEALSALLAKEIYLEGRHKIEEQLEGIALGFKKDDGKADRPAKIKRARHEKGFSAHDGGFSWTIKKESSSKAANAKTLNPTESIVLPEAYSNRLTNLNQSSLVFDQMHEEIERQKEQLFSDWYKYMLCIYPPEHSADGYPDADEVKYHISETRLKSLNDKIENAGELRINPKPRDGNPLAEAPNINSDGSNSYGQFLAELINEMAEDVVKLNPLIDLIMDKGDSGSEVVDHSSFKNHAQLGGNAVISNDIDKETCLMLSQKPKGDYLSLGDLCYEGNDHKELCVQAWVKTGQKDGVIASFDPSCYWELSLEEGFPEFIINTISGKKQISGSTSVSDDQWHHISAVFDKEEVRIYVDGVLDKSTSSGVTFGSDKKRYGFVGVGSCAASEDGLKKVNSYFTGQIGSLRIYHRALDDNEIFRDMNTLVRPLFTLTQTPQPRFWKPVPPVVLISGERAQQSLRYGKDGSLTSDGTLECLEKDLTGTYSNTLIPNNFKVLRDAIDETNPMANNITNGDPWNPLSLDWEVQFFPSDLDLGSDTNFRLEENRSDLEINEISYNRSLSIYSGSSILSGKTSGLFKDSIEAYIKKYVLENNELMQELGYLDEGSNTISGKNIPELDNKLEIKSLIQNYFKIKGPFDVDNPTHSALQTYLKITADGFNCLSQALGGFNESLLMQKQTLQLKISDPIGFEEYTGFTNDVGTTVGNSSKRAPMPNNDFNPIRSGVMKINKLRLVDTFGQYIDLDLKDVISTKKMELPSYGQVLLPPRLLQPAKVMFRWLSARQGREKEEMNIHPSTSPICGWMLYNKLDESLMLFEANGQALGAITKNEDDPWKAAPGPDPKEIEDIENDHLKRMAKFITGKPNGFLEDFQVALDDAILNINPDSAAQNQSMAHLFGRPLALVRASVKLDLYGSPSVNQSWNSFETDMEVMGKERLEVRKERQTEGYTGISFPARIGEYRQMNDGVVGYWKEDETGKLGEKFYAPQTNKLASDYIMTHADSEAELKDKVPHDPINIQLRPNEPAKNFLLLFDPRGKVHLTTGILPGKVIDIPADQYKSAMDAIQFSFISTPHIISEEDLIPKTQEAEEATVMLSPDAGPDYAWNWVHKLEQNNPVWKSTSVEKPKESADLFRGKNMIMEGWLSLRKAKKDKTENKD